MEKEGTMVETAKEKKESTTVKKTGWQKWLPRIGHFLMYGGWMLILVLVLGIVILVSVLTH